MLNDFIEKIESFVNGIGLSLVESLLIFWLILITVMVLVLAIKTSRLKADSNELKNGTASILHDISYLEDTLKEHNKEIDKIKKSNKANSTKINNKIKKLEDAKKGIEKGQNSTPKKTPSKNTKKTKK